MGNGSTWSPSQGHIETSFFSFNEKRRLIVFSMIFKRCLRKQVSICLSYFIVRFRK